MPLVVASLKLISFFNLKAAGFIVCLVILQIIFSLEFDYFCIGVGFPVLEEVNDAKASAL